MPSWWMPTHGRSVGSDDGLVGLDHHAGDGRDQARSPVISLVLIPVSSFKKSLRTLRAMTTSSRLQLPARSPMPLMVHSTCLAPAWTAARLLPRPGQVVVAVH